MRLELCPCCKSTAELRNTLGKIFWVQCTNPECGLQTKKCGCDNAAEIVAARWNNRSDWISVKDKLPNQSERVLIAHKHGVTIAWRNGGYWTKGAATKHRIIKTVTHWMPLPQPPKEDDE